MNNKKLSILLSIFILLIHTPSFAEKTPPNNTEPTHSEHVINKKDIQNKNVTTTPDKDTSQNNTHKPEISPPNPIPNHNSDPPKPEVVPDPAQTEDPVKPQPAPKTEEPPTNVNPDQSTKSTKPPKNPTPARAPKPVEKPQPEETINADASLSPSDVTLPEISNIDIPEEDITSESSKRYSGEKLIKGVIAWIMILSGLFIIIWVILKNQKIPKGSKIGTNKKNLRLHRTRRLYYKNLYRK